MMGTPSDCKKSGRDDAPLRSGIFYAGGMDVSVGGELQTRSGGAAGIPPGNDVAERGLAHARQRINATYRFLVEINNLLRLSSHRTSLEHR